MKKYLSIILILLSVFLVNFHKNSSLISVASKVCNNYEIIDDNFNGQIVKVDNENLQKIMDELCVEIISKNYVCGRDIIEGYSNVLNDYIVINGRKTNIQISIIDNYILVGYPLINNYF